MELTEFSLILMPSPSGGIGVFAAHEIPAGSRLTWDKMCTRIMNPKEIPEAFRKYCIYISDSECKCPLDFSRMEVLWYLNHSDRPNLKKETETSALILRDLKAGEELFVDYNDLEEPEHLKESFYKQ